MINEIEIEYELSCYTCHNEEAGLMLKTDAVYCGLKLQYDCGCNFKINVSYNDGNCQYAHVDGDGDECELCDKHMNELKRSIED